MNDLKLEKALTWLLEKAKTTSKAKKAGEKIIPTAKAGGYTVDDIKILSLEASGEYNTMNICISVKKDDEDSKNMRRFKIAIPMTKISMWQNIQIKFIENSFGFEDGDDFGSDDEITEPAVEDLAISTGSKSLTTSKEVDGSITDNTQKPKPNNNGFFTKKELQQLKDNKGLKDENDNNSKY